MCVSIVHPHLGKMNPFLPSIFQMGWNHQPAIVFQITWSGLFGDFFLPILLCSIHHENHHLGEDVLYFFQAS